MKPIGCRSALNVYNAVCHPRQKLQGRLCWVRMAVDLQIVTVIVHRNEQNDIAEYTARIGSARVQTPAGCHKTDVIPDVNVPLNRTYCVRPAR